MTDRSVISVRETLPALGDFERLPDLPFELMSLLHQVPVGRVTTYGGLARALGDIKAVRWVGEYLRHHDHDADCPCHRVVRIDGAVGLFVTGDPADKIKLLRSEGVRMVDDRVRPDEGFCEDFDCAGPLLRLRRLQEEEAACVRVTPLTTPPETIAGVDVSYVTKTRAVAAYVLLDAANLRTLWTTTLSAPATFPYIPGYLTYRELPILLSLFEEVRRQGRVADVTFVDGNGVLHPRRAGIATMFGLATQVSTIGIGKKLLCGRVDVDGMTADECRPVRLEVEVLGMAMQGASRFRPIYASPGNLIDMADVIDMTRVAWPEGRQPVPIALADRLSRKLARR